MLASLSIRDVVLIEHLELSLHDGLCVLTGETGAGKSILLDALGLALGNRADQRLVRAGAEKAQVVACFEVDPGDPVIALLAEHGQECDPGQLLLRRVLGADGRSRAFINDQPVSVGLLRSVGDTLIEIQGQFEDRGLLDPGRHCRLLDAHGGLSARAAEVAGLWSAWSGARKALAEAERDLAASRDDEAFLRHALEELEALGPQAGEETGLAEERQFLLHREKLVDAVNGALAAVTGDGQAGGGAETGLARAQQVLARVAAHAAGRLDPALAALDRAQAETEEALAQLHSLAGDMEPDSGRLKQVEERFFALKDLARKHRVEVDALPALATGFTERLARLDRGGARVAKSARQAAAAAERYRGAAERLSAARIKAAAGLDRAVNAELPALKLGQANFRTRSERQEESAWGAQGLDRVAFEVRTNPGTAPGPLARIASGGELARFLLALKVALAEVNPRQALVFDEVDSSVGGATAHAVGERLERLAQARQVLVVTHSPQVAACGSFHWRISKEAGSAASKGAAPATRAGELTAPERREEIARMLSGAEITDEARAAADRLMGAA